MEKFVSIPVTSKENVYLRAVDLVGVEQASTTTVTLRYKGGKVVTVTHAAAGAGDETQRDAIEDAVVKALSLKWTEPVHVVDSLPYAVSAVSVA